MIWLHQVSKCYQPGIMILDQLDLHIKRGEYVYITGCSGAGKSTLLKLLFASEQPTSGRVIVGGCDVGSLSKRDLPYFRRKIGVVYQDFKLLPRRTVFENVAFALEVIGRPYSEIRKRVEQILNEVGLTACMRQLPTSLSGGEQQRVAIARALVRDPWLLLADEPTGNLDYSMAEEILAMFERANQRGTTIMIATHAQDLIAKQKHIYRLVHLENACFADTTADPYAVEFSTPMILEHHSSITHRAE